MQVLGEDGVEQGTPLKSQSVGPSPAFLKFGQLLGAHIEPYLSWKVVETEETCPQERPVSSSRLPSAPLEWNLSSQGALDKVLGLVLDV